MLVQMGPEQQPLQTEETNGRSCFKTNLKRLKTCHKFRTRSLWVLRRVLQLLLAIYVLGITIDLVYILSCSNIEDFFKLYAIIWAFNVLASIYIGVYCCTFNRAEQKRHGVIFGDRQRDEERQLSKSCKRGCDWCCYISFLVIVSLSILIPMLLIIFNDKSDDKSGGISAMNPCESPTYSFIEKVIVFAKLASFSLYIAIRLFMLFVLDEDINNGDYASTINDAPPPQDPHPPSEFPQSRSSGIPQEPGNISNTETSQIPTEEDTSNDSENNETAASTPDTRGNNDNSRPLTPPLIS